MRTSAPQPLVAGHRLEGFDCGKPALNDWLVRHARQSQASGSAKTYVVVDADRVMGYFSLTVGQADAVEVSEPIRKGMGSYPIPVVILARLAVSLPDQGKGIGVGMMQDHLLDSAGNASLMTTALRHTLCDRAAGNYRVLTTMAAKLLAAATQRKLPQLGEKLYLEVFAQPEAIAAGISAGSEKSCSSTFTPCFENKPRAAVRMARTRNDDPADMAA